MTDQEQRTMDLAAGILNACQGAYSTREKRVALAIVTVALELEMPEHDHEHECIECGEFHDA